MSQIPQSPSSSNVFMQEITGMETVEEKAKTKKIKMEIEGKNRGLVVLASYSVQCI